MLRLTLRRTTAGTTAPSGQSPGFAPGPSPPPAGAAPGTPCPLGMGGHHHPHAVEGDHLLQEGPIKLRRLFQGLQAGAHAGQALLPPGVDQ